MMFESKQVFVVDDDVSVCRALKLLLVAYKFKVETFLSSEDFLNTVFNSTPGCLLLDIHMPGLDGWATLVRLKTLGSIRPVIVISADKNGGLRERALKAGAIGFFQKPINDQELVDKINQTFLKKGEAI